MCICIKIWKKSFLWKIARSAKETWNLTIFQLSYPFQWRMSLTDQKCILHSNSTLEYWSSKSINRSFFTRHVAQLFNICGCIFHKLQLKTEYVYFKLYSTLIEETICRSLSLRRQKLAMKNICVFVAIVQPCRLRLYKKIIIFRFSKKNSLTK